MDNNAFWFVDGHWVHPREAVISINDVAVLRGYSAFESLRTYDRRPFLLDEHLDRLYRSAKLIDLDVPYTRADIIRVIMECIERNEYKHATIRILVTGGQSEDGIMPTERPTLAVLITPLAERNIELFARGIKLITTHLQRTSPEAKTTSYVSAIRALKEAARSGASDALFVDEHGHVLEGTRSNFFVFLGDTLVTPLSGILIGITRNVVLDLARECFTVEERPILLDELQKVDEAFVSSSSKEITPVVQVNNIIIGDGKPGPRTSELHRRFVELIARGEF